MLEKYEPALGMTMAIVGIVAIVFIISVAKGWIGG